MINTDKFMLIVELAIEVASRKGFRGKGASLETGCHSTLGESKYAEIANIEFDMSNVVAFIMSLPSHLQAVVVSRHGDAAMRDDAIEALIPYVDDNKHGDEVKREAISNWITGASMSGRALANEYGGCKTGHCTYRNAVAEKLDSFVDQAVSMFSTKGIALND